MIEKEKLSNFEKSINFYFKDKNNLINALIHPSYVKGKRTRQTESQSNFERLEFLGDRVLGLAIASLIYEKFQFLNEGDFLI